MLLNLLTNALKFQTFGIIKVNLELSIEDSQNFLDVEVEDSGIGLTSDEIKRIFTPFGRLNNQKSREMNKLGNGVGLSICKKICEELGGSIEVQSIPNRGSTFSFRVKAFKVYIDLPNKKKKKKRQKSQNTKLINVDEEQDENNSSSNNEEE